MSRRELKLKMLLLKMMPRMVDILCAGLVILIFSLLLGGLYPFLYIFSFGYFVLLWTMACINKREFNDDVKKWYVVYHLFGKEIEKIDNGYQVKYDAGTCEFLKYEIRKGTFYYVFFKGFYYETVFDEKLRKELYEYIEKRFENRESDKQLNDLLQAATKVTLDKSA